MVSLSELRRLGWDFWDPIGLKETECPRDEYDGYLLGLVGLLRRPVTPAEAVEYLVEAETRTMGLDPRPDTRRRAEHLVEAVQTYLNELPPGPPKAR